MKRMVVDWKFALTTVLSLLAVALPTYLWQADLSAYSLTVRLVSSSALELPRDSKIHDMQVIVNGTKIEAPHIYSLLLINTGSKPIPTASFESALQIRTMNGAKLITAQITSTEPADIPVTSAIEDNQVKILPFLSNPKDQIALTLVSSGPLELSPKARIAGVKDVIFEDKSQSKSQPFEALFYATVGVLSLGLYLFFLPTSRHRGALRIGGGIRFMTTCVFLVSGVYFASSASRMLDYDGKSSTLILLPLFLIGAVITVFLVRSNRAHDPSL